MKNRSIVVVLSLLILVLGVAIAPAMAQDEEMMEIPEPALVYDAPEGYEMTADNTLVNGDETILIVDPAAYTMVLGNEEFDDIDSEFAFMLDRVGYAVGSTGDAPSDKVLSVQGVTLSRRNQQGQAFLVDLGVGLKGVVVSLHTGRGRVGAPQADANVVIDSMAFPQDIVQALETAGNFTTLLSALEAAGLDMSLHGEGPFTVFAPTDAAFENLLAGLGLRAEQLLAADYLDDVLLYHVVNGSVDSAMLAEDYLDQNSIPTLLTGNNFFAFTGGDDTLYVNNDNAPITETDIMATNGVIHVIGGVLLPQCAIDAVNGEGGCD